MVPDISNPLSDKQILWSLFDFIDCKNIEVFISFVTSIKMDIDLSIVNKYMNPQNIHVYNCLWGKMF